MAGIADFLNRVPGSKVPRRARGSTPALIERALGGRIIGAIARGATEIEACEKPVQNKANDGKDDPPAPDKGYR